jgi:2-haloacid dehalogenase
MEAGEKEYTYLSLCGKYVKFFDVFRSIFYRTLGQAGIEEPRKFATDEDREYLLASYRLLKPRTGLVECFAKLRAGGFTVWALTSGDIERVAGYLAAAGATLPEENFVSCDTIGVGKPAPDSYKYILDKFEKKDLDVWFAAAHMWDAAAARQCG